MEEASVGTFVGDLEMDSSIRNTISPPITYELDEAMESRNSLFRVEKTTGRLFIKSRVDREALCPLLPLTGQPCSRQLSVFVPPETWINVNIFITDINDHAPKFMKTNETLQFSEGAKRGTTIPLSLAVDEDSLPNNINSYDIFDIMNTFSLTYKPPLSLQLVLNGDLDHETFPFYNVTLTACDGGTPQRRCGYQYLFITVIDENDNPPVFQQNLYSLNISENTLPGTEIVRVRATDKDSDMNGLVKYRISSLSGPSILSYFRIDPDTGVVYLMERLVAHSIPFFSFIVEAYDSGGVQMKSQTSIHVSVRDVNDQAPVIRIFPTNKKSQEKSSNESLLHVKENSKGGMEIARVIVTDDDSGENGRVSCQVTESAFYFSLMHSYSMKRKESYRLLTTNNSINRETMSNIQVKISCHDFGTPRRLSTDVLTDVAVLDEDEFPPVFPKTLFNLSLPENYPLHRVFIQVKAEDADAGAQLSYSLSVDGKQFFQIDKQDASLSAVSILDRELTPKINFQLFAHDLTSTKYTATASVIIHIEDVNDCVPQLESSRTFSIQENHPFQTIVGQLSASDMDEGLAGQVRFSLVQMIPQGDIARTQPCRNDSISIQETGEIIALNSLDRETCEIIHLVVVLYDLGEPSLSFTATVSLFVLDVNDNAPVWEFPPSENYYMNITGGHIAPSKQLLSLKAYDEDSPSNANVTYAIFQGQLSHFQVDPWTGSVFTLRQISPGDYHLAFRACDNGQPVHCSDRTMMLTILSLPGWRSQFLDSRGFRWNLMMLIGLGMFAVIVGLIFVVAIVLLRRKNHSIMQQQKQNHLQQWIEDTHFTKDGTPSQVIPPLLGEYYSTLHHQPGGLQSQNSSSSHIPMGTLSAGGHSGYYDLRQTLHVRALMSSNGGDTQEVNSADSGHGASEEEALNVEAQRNYQSGGFLSVGYPTFTFSRPAAAAAAGSNVDYRYNGNAATNINTSTACTSMMLLNNSGYRDSTRGPATPLFFSPLDESSIKMCPSRYSYSRAAGTGTISKQQMPLFVYETTPMLCGTNEVSCLQNSNHLYQFPLPEGELLSSPSTYEDSQRSNSHLAMATQPSYYAHPSSHDPQADTHGNNIPPPQMSGNSQQPHGTFSTIPSYSLSEYCQSSCTVEGPTHNKMGQSQV